MKNMKKIGAMVLAMVLAVALCVPALAAPSTPLDPATGTSNADVGTQTYTGEDATTDGKITLTNATAGTLYGLYKIFDATYAGNAVSYTVVKDSHWYTKIDSDENAPFTLTTNDEKTYYVTAKDGVTGEAIANWLKENISGAPTLFEKPVTPGEGSATIEWSNVPYGYYYISGSLGAAVTIDTAMPAVSVIDKNQEPGNLEKTATNGVTMDDNQIKSAQIGDVVDFEITYSATNYDGDEKIVEYYVDDDMPKGFDLVANSIAVKVGDKELTVNEDYTIAYGTEDTDDFKVTIPWVDTDSNKSSLYDSPTTITVTYKATMNADAVIDVEEDEDGNRIEGNTNTATITHKNDGKDTPEDPDPKKDTDTETVYTYALAIKKVDTNGQPLEGAEFVLKQGETEVKVSGENGVYTVDSNGTATIKSPASGLIIIKGVEGVEYTLTETKAPKGYNLLPEPVKVTPVKTGETTTTVTKYIDENGNVVETETEVEVKVENTPVAATVVVVVNFTGAQLPSTGGIGTTIFYVVGGILVIGAVILLVTRKRVSDEV